MEFSEKPIWNSYTGRELTKLSIVAPDPDIRKKVLHNWDQIAKPLDGLGRFELLTAQIGAILGTEKPDLSEKAVIIMCADNGVVEEGISQSQQEVTANVAKMMGSKQSSVGRMAETVHADTIPIDIGINTKQAFPGVISHKVKYGTNNFAKEAAMTEEEAVRAIVTGIDAVYSCKQSGYSILATGEMGIGNTTTSSAVAAAILNCGAQKVTGRGAGLSDAGLLKKQQVITDAIKKYALYEADALTVLRTVGGLDIAGLAGVCMGGALFHIPIVLDGVISMVAALVAERLLPGTKDFLIPSHKGKEPAVELLSKELDLAPVIDAGLALGEGTGAVMMFALLDVALSVYHSSNTFHDIQMQEYTRL
ncbi:MAG: nicotinate-nucleotide--dimethylbenzimidazole phosphoribosyltransferase [Lachnospiraceae bacterium]